MNDSILNTTKKTLGIPVDDSAFDLDILLHINSALSVLNQLGVGPSDSFLVVDKDTEWSSLTDDVILLSMAKPFVALKVRVTFDPPGTSFLIDAIEKSIAELTWRIQIQADPYIPPVIIPEEG